MWDRQTPVSSLQTQDLMRSPFLCGARFSQAPSRCHVDVFLLRITEPACREAINSSVALKRPDRSFGGTTDTSVSSFIEGSARVYISVVCMFVGSQRGQVLILDRCPGEELWAVLTFSS